jgi:cytochrome c nitrite reductase small subunit
VSPFAAITVLLGLLTLAGTLYLLTHEPSKSPAPVRLGFVTLGALTFYKLVAFVTLVPLPLATAASAHFELLEGAKEVSACGACHVMTPMVTDMLDAKSDSLAARHFKNRYIADEQCYHCHAGYGLTGAFDAKLEGYRHLVRYTTGAYEEPIKKRGPFDSASCLSCHVGTRGFTAINSHAATMERLTHGAMSCTNCHGPAHPTRTERTPGSPTYHALMEEP